MKEAMRCPTQQAVETSYAPLGAFTRWRGSYGL